MSGEKRSQYGQVGGQSKRARVATIEKGPSKTTYQKSEPRIPPITDYEQVPEGWYEEDDDIDDRDVEKVIERCHDRIQDGIMPQWWEAKLEIYQKIKDRLDSLKEAADPRMGLEAIVRVNNLEVIKSHLQTNGDPFSQLINVNALIDGYRKGTVIWTHGKVSYWSAGKCLHGPVDFDKTLDDAIKYNDLCGGNSFWVEGLNGPGPLPSLAYNSPAWHNTIPYSSPFFFQHKIDFDFRVPGAGSLTLNDENNNAAIRRPFLDDTGSSMPIIYQDDMWRIQARAGGEQPPFLCYVNLRADGRNLLTDATSLIEFNIKNAAALPAETTWMRPPSQWVRVQTVMRPQIFNASADCRLSGNWMRHMIYTGTAPNNLGQLYLAENVSKIRALLPLADVRNARPPAPGAPPGVSVFQGAPSIYFWPYMSVLP